MIKPWACVSSGGGVQGAARSRAPSGAIVKINISVMYRKGYLEALSVRDLLGLEANSADGRETGGEAALVNR